MRYFGTLIFMIVYTLILLSCSRNKLVADFDAIYGADLNGDCILLGKIIDNKSLMPIKGVYVRMINTGFETVTDMNGNYLIQYIRPDFYKIQVEYLGYKTQIYDSLKLNTNSITVHNFVMVDTTITIIEEW